MSRYRVNIERVNVSMHGVSAAIVEQTTQNFETELKRQLGSVRLSQGNAVDLKSLDLGPINIESGTDAETLRSLIAEHLSTALLRELYAGNNTEAAWP